MPPPLTRRPKLVAVPLALALGLVLAAAPGAAHAGWGDYPTQAYGGPGAWVDRYDRDALGHPVRTVRRAARAGVRTLYVETGSWRVPPGVDVIRPAAISTMIEAAHARGMRVVAWYLPALSQPRRDFRRTMAAIEFTTPRGHRFDSFALDIEATLIQAVPRRNRALIELSKRIRSAAGAAYPLGAIVPDSRSSTISPGLWPGFPHARLGRIYDVFLPMSYSTVRGQGARFVYRYTLANLATIRERTGDPDVAIHPIGGLADELDRREADAVIRGARDGGAIGASFYTFRLSGREEWRALDGL